ncbi:MAG TPA: PQQ-dependent sugar dehydrogenase, partial [Holophagaceae bacterium]|nr:PQQ-dependent sugar dehydrogenase [Holophagaceae bacterium]
FHTFTVDSNGERGLLDVAFDPAFATNGFVYCYHTVPGTASSAAHNRVSRLHVNAAAPDISDGTDTDLLDLNDLSSATNHNGGGLHFGLDGELYISVGENADPSNSQSKTTLLGKILRMNADGSIPTDNPFYGDASFTGVYKLIWAAGLRNPFTFAVQPGTGRIFLNDVGSSPPQAREEINDGIGGSNYGWNLAEGIVATPPAVPFGTYRNPLFAYDHSSGACAIAGGAFYDPATAVYPTAYVGRYFYADLCGGWVHVFNLASSSSIDLLGGFNEPVDVQLGPDGLIYVLGHGDGTVWRITFTP